MILFQISPLTEQQFRSLGSFTGIGLRAGNAGFIAMDGQEALRLGGEWDMNWPSQGTLRISRESGDWVLPGDAPLSLGLQTVELSAHAGNGRLAGELTAQGKHFGDLHATVFLPLSGTLETAPLTGQMRFNMTDLAWLGPAINSNLKSAGQLTLEADISGNLHAPQLVGTVLGSDLALAFLDQGVRLQQGRLAARFDHEAVHIDTLSFVAPSEPVPHDSLLKDLNLYSEPGKLSAMGVINLNGEEGTLDISASRFPLTQRKDRWIIASGSGHVSLLNNILKLGGNITADAGLISEPVSARPQLSDDIAITGRLPVTYQGPLLSVDASLLLGEHFYLRASGLEARLSGQLSVFESPGQPLRVTGSIAARDASFDAYGQHLTVERGIVNFQGSLYDPGLNILAKRMGLSVEAGVEVTGTATHPSVRLVSTPVVPDTEKLSWIVLGRLPDASGTDTSLLMAAAGSILGGSSGGITGTLKQSLGIDELSLRQADNSTTASKDSLLTSQIVTVGKRLSARAFLSYERGVTAVAGVTKLTYTLTPKVNIVTQAGADNAIDIYYTFSFD